MSIISKIYKITHDNIKKIMKFNVELLLGVPNRVFENEKAITYYYKGNNYDLDIFYSKKENTITVEVSKLKIGKIIYTTTSKLIEVPSHIAEFISFTCYSCYWYYICN